MIVFGEKKEEIKKGNRKKTKDETKKCIFQKVVKRKKRKQQKKENREKNENVTEANELMKKREDNK